jgi:hypothetical protein
VVGVICVIGVSSSVSMAVRTLEKKSERVAVSVVAGRASGVCMLGSAFHTSIHLDIKPMYSASASTLTIPLVVPFWYRAAATAYEVVKCTPMLGDATSPEMGFCCGDRTTRAPTNGNARSRLGIFILDCSDYNNVCRKKERKKERNDSSSGSKVEEVNLGGATVKKQP